MTLADRLERAERARAKVGRVMELLERPTVAALDQSTAELSAAVECIQEIQREIAGGGRTAPTCPSKLVMVELRKDLRRVSRLLRHAWELRAGGGQSGYTRKGEPAPQPAATARVVLEG